MADTPNNLQTSFIRTLTPAVVAFVVAILTRWGVHVNNDVVQTGVPLALGFVYYAVARLLEEKVNPAFGKLLGKAVAPDYGPAKDAALVQLDQWKDQAVQAAVADLTEQAAKGKTAFWTAEQPVPEAAPADPAV